MIEEKTRVTNSREYLQALLDAPEHVTRRNPEMEKYVEIRPVVMEGYPDACNVFLKVTNQSFCVTRYGCDTKEDAEWTRDMLCVALAKIVSDTLDRVAKGGRG